MQSDRKDAMREIRLEHIYKDYIPGTHVIKDFNLTINEGEFIVLVGPSGCGKSTLLRMIAGLEDITAGKLYFDDELMNDVHPKDRDTAMVFQNYALYPQMTVAENMGFGLKMQKVPQKDIDERVDRTSKVIGLEDYLDRLPKELSGGQRQRVALGRAISRNPKVFLMDEPLSNLDAKLRVQTRSEISNISKQLDNTTIYVTHDQVEAITISAPFINTGLYANMLLNGETWGIVVGHDHDNNFDAVKYGVHLAYANSSGYQTYGDLPKGGSLIEISLDPYEIKKTNVTYSDI